MQRMTIRDIAFRALTPGGVITEDFLKQTTDEEYAEADRQYDEWYEQAYMRPCIAVDVANEASDAIMRLNRTTEQRAYENGIKTGARLMLEILGEGAVTA